MALGEQFDTVLGAARTGADWAWAQLYDDLAPTVLGYLRGQRAPSPEDVAGEVFLQVVRDLHRFDGDEAAFRSWVFTIAHHRLIDARRGAKRRPADPVPAGDLEMHLPSVEAEGAALDTVATEELVALLDTLTSEQREVLLLRVVGGLTVREVGEALGMRVGAVKARQRRALNALRRAMSSGAYPLDGARRYRE